MTAFNTAIGAAEGAKAAATTQAAVDAALGLLKEALAAFNAAVNKNGPGTKSEGFTPDDLAALITQAEDAIAGVRVSTDGADIPAGEQWVTEAAVEALEAAVAAATDGGTFTDQVYQDLAAALKAFNDAKQAGTDNGGDTAKTLVITSLLDITGLDLISLWDGVTSWSPTIGGIPDPDDSPSGTITVPLKNLRFSDNSDEPEFISDWTGTGEYFVMLWYGDKALITTSKVLIDKAVTTIPFSDFEKREDGEDYGEQIGEIHGTINLTDIPVSGSGSYRRVYISAGGHNGEFGWSSHSSWIDLSGVSGSGGNNIQWTIPLYETDIHSLRTWDEITGTQSVYFRLYVDFEENSGLEIHLDNKDLDLTNKESIDAGNLGTASLAYITLKGTITVSYNNQPVPIVGITAKTSNKGLGDSYPRAPGAGTAWTIYLSPLASETEISFDVEGMDSNWMTLFEEDTGITTTVFNQSIADININLGDVSGGSVFAQVYNRDGTEYGGDDLTVKATFVEDPVGDIHDGRLTFFLTQKTPVLPDDAPEETSMPEGLETSPANVKCCYYELFSLLNSNGTGPEYLTFVKSGEFDSCVLFIYFSASCTVNGTITDVGSVFDNIAFDQGWNMVLIDGTTAERIYELPSDFKWIAYNR
jgi:hypothetical protein